eukprot:m.286476 g.286476  ORF g.286476 m.286476 type:complete len:1337 (+) comp15780_c4_seq5:79-4089(+)
MMLGGTLAVALVVLAAVSAQDHPHSATAVVDRLDLTVCLSGVATLKLNRTTAWFVYHDRDSWVSLVHLNQRAIGWGIVCPDDHALLANNQTWTPYAAEQPQSFEVSSPFPVNFTQEGMESGLSIVREDWLNGDSIQCGKQNCVAVLRTFIVEQPCKENNFTATVELMNTRSDDGIINTLSIVPWSVPLPQYDNLTLETSAIQVPQGLDPAPRCTDQPCMLLSPSHVASCACACFYADSAGVLVACSKSRGSQPVNVSLFPANTNMLYLSQLREVTHWDCGYLSPLKQLQGLRADAPPFIKACIYDGVRDTLRLIRHRNTLISGLFLAEPDAFHNLPELRELDLGLSGSIVPHVLSETMLIGTPNLHTLILHTAGMDWIPRKFFEQVPNLDYLDVEDTVGYIPDDLFHFSPHVKTFYPPLHCNNKTNDGFECNCELFDAVPTSKFICATTCPIASIGDRHEDLELLPAHVLPITLGTEVDPHVPRYTPGSDVNVSAGSIGAQFECRGIRGTPTWQPNPAMINAHCSVYLSRDSVGVERVTFSCDDLVFNPQQSAFTMSDAIVAHVRALFLNRPQGLRFLTRNLLAPAAQTLQHFKVQDVVFIRPPDPYTFAGLHLQSLELINTNLSPSTLNSTFLWYFLAPHLQHLDLSGSPVVPVPTVIWKSLTKLASLMLSSTGVTMLGDVLTCSSDSESQIVSRSLALLNLTGNTIVPFQVAPLLGAFPNLTTLAISGYVDPASLATAPLPVYPFLPEDGTTSIASNNNTIQRLDFHDITHLINLVQFPNLREVSVKNGPSIPFRLFVGALPTTVTKLTIDAPAMDYIEPGALHNVMSNAGSKDHTVSINARNGQLSTELSISCTVEGCVCFGAHNFLSNVGCVGSCSVLKTASVKCIYPDVCEEVCGPSSTTALLACDSESEVFVSQCPPLTASRSIAPVAVGIAVTAVVALGIALFFLTRQRRNSHAARTAELLQHKVNALLQSRFPQLKGYSLAMPPLFQLSSLTIEEQLGKGNFSSVSRAVTLAHGAVGSLAAGTAVALKTTDDDAMSLTAALLEAQLMHTYPHPNIVSVVAICLDSGACHLALELMDESLLNFVRGSQTPPPDSTVASMMLDVAKACEHVASCNIVHRDLSARNCGILRHGKGLVPKVKLFDFGLARVCNDGGVYTSTTQQQAQPIAWMAPESLTDETFSEKSDVWGFGVLCWEMCTMGTKPWAQFMLQEIVVAVSKQGKHLERPGTAQLPGQCSDAVWDTLCRCWQTNPQHRPPFSELVRLVSALLQAPQRIATIPGTAMSSNSPARAADTTVSCGEPSRSSKQPSFHQHNQLFHFVTDPSDHTEVSL